MWPSFKITLLASDMLRHHSVNHKSIPFTDAAWQGMKELLCVF